MDYEKKYNEALERAKDYFKANQRIGELEENDMLSDIFPELKESEDERIRKEILTAFSCGHDNSDIYGHGITYGQVRAWLEKQGTPAKLSEEEQNRFAKGVLSSCALSFIDYLDAHKYEGKMCVSNGECEDIENAFHNAMWDRLHRYYCKYIEKQGKKKPYKEDFHDLLMDVKFGIEPSPKQGEKKPWSEEDRRNLNWVINVWNRLRRGGDAQTTPSQMEYLENFLKSLKDRYAWKPSDEQMQCLYDAIEHYQTNGYPATKLKELYEQMQKIYKL